MVVSGTRQGMDTLKTQTDLAQVSFEEASGVWKDGDVTILAADVAFPGQGPQTRDSALRHPQSLSRWDSELQRDARLGPRFQSQGRDLPV